MTPKEEALTLKAIPLGSELRLYGRRNTGITAFDSEDIDADGEAAKPGGAHGQYPLNCD